jgi:hypothetical protein
MFNFKNFKSKLRLTKENIEKELQANGYNDYDLAKYYIGGFRKFNVKFKSDLRTDDKNNSMICRIQNGKLIISDFGYKTGMNIYSYLMEKYHLYSKDGFFEALDMIRKDFRLNNVLGISKSKSSIGELPIKYYEEVKESSLPVKIEVKRRRINGNIYWRDIDIEYWKNFGISIKKLEEKGIAPLEKFWITNFNKGGIRKEFKINSDLCYVYPFYRNESGFFMYKIYLPHGLNGNKDIKWVSNVNKHVIQNLEHIDKEGDLLIIQSSYKDIMCMEELVKGVNIISFNGEGMWCKDEIWRDLCSRFKHQIIFANNDYPKLPNPGLEFAKKHSLMYKIPFVCTPDCTTSDISDYHKKYGKKETLQLLKKVFKNIKLLI